MRHATINRWGLGLVLFATALATGCGGGGGSASSAAAPIEPGYKNVSGPLDPVQDGLETVGDSSAPTPTVGTSLKSMTESLVCLTDSVDVLAASLQELASSQDPQQFAEVQSQLSPALECGLDKLKTALESLVAPGLPLSGAPSAATVQEILAQIAALEDELGGAGPSPADLGTVTDALAQVSSTVAELANQVPGGANAGQVEVLLSAISVTVFNVTAILDEAGQLDAAGFNAAVTATVSQLTNLFTSSSLTGQGVIDSAFRSAAVQIVNAASPAQQALSAGLLSITVPLFSALQTVLSAVGGNDLFAGAVAGLLPGDSSTPSLDPVLDLLDGGGSAGGLPVPVLGDVLSLLGLG